MSEYNDLKDLKKRIFDDDRINEIFEKLDCTNIVNKKSYNSWATAKLPEEFQSSNKRAVQIKNHESLYCSIRNRDFSGDIYSLVSYIYYECRTEEEINDNLFVAKQWLIDELGYDEFNDYDSNNLVIRKKDRLSELLNNIKKKRKRRERVENRESNKVISEDVLRYYKMNSHKLWINEGIRNITQRFFEVGYDMETKRIIVPIRNVNGDLIGVKGRIVEERENEDQKYMYLHKMNKEIELYGLHKTMTHIMDSNEVLLFEGFKSVFKSYQYGYKHCASIEGSDISDFQASLIRGFGINTKIILCFDNDKNEEDLKKYARQFRNRRVYAIIDRDGLLDEKDSPVDKGKEVWEKLYQSMVKM